MRSRKFAAWLLSILCVATLSFGAACGGKSNQGNQASGTQSSQEQEQATEIEQVYAQYVSYMSAKQQVPLSYEDWLSSIKGEKGDQGVGIKKVEYDKDGNLVITLTDGTKQTVAMPEKETGGEESTQEGTPGLHYMRIPGKDEYRVVSLGMAEDTNIVIPATYKGLPVTEIADEAFYKGGADTNLWKHLVLSITLPDTITHIGKSAFYKCENLTELIIPSGVTSIGNSAFEGCLNLKEVVIPSSMTSIGERVFGDCKKLTKVVIPDTITSIGNGAFRYCESLTEVVIPDSVVTIADFAFYQCFDLTIYCEAESKPSDWALYWNSSNCKVVWGYQGA